MSARIWRAGRFEIDLERPRVMGIVNITPDSFSDGNPDITPERAIALCEKLLADGADILDIGGEVRRAALALGADIVNDITALRAPDALEVVAAHPSCGVCLMHMKGTPTTM